MNCPGYKLGRFILIYIAADDLKSRFGLISRNNVVIYESVDTKKGLVSYVRENVLSAGALWSPCRGFNSTLITHWHYIFPLIIQQLTTETESRTVTQNTVKTVFNIKQGQWLFIHLFMCFNLNPVPVSFKWSQSIVATGNFSTSTYPSFFCGIYTNLPVQDLGGLEPILPCIGQRLGAPWESHTSYMSVHCGRKITTLTTAHQPKLSRSKWWLMLSQIRTSLWTIWPWQNPINSIVAISATVTWIQV